MANTADIPSTQPCPLLFVVSDHNRQALTYVYFEDEPGRRSAAKLLSKDEARRIAVEHRRAAGAFCVMLSGGAERYLVRAVTSSFDAVSAALHAETAEVAAGNLRRHSHNCSHSRHRIRRPALPLASVLLARISTIVELRSITKLARRKDEINQPRA